MFAGNRLEFHALLVRNEFHMPEVKSKASTLGWMYEVFRGYAWLPKQSEVRSLQVANAPRGDVLQRYLLDLMQAADVPPNLQASFQVTKEHLRSH